MFKLYFTRCYPQPVGVYHNGFANRFNGYCTANDIPSANQTLPSQIMSEGQWAHKNMMVSRSSINFQVGSNTVGGTMFWDVHVENDTGMGVRFISFNIREDIGTFTKGALLYQDITVACNVSDGSTISLAPSTSDVQHYYYIADPEGTSDDFNVTLTPNTTIQPVKITP